MIVRPGEGLRVGNVEFLALSEDTPRFNASIITMAPHRHGPPSHVHRGEDDAFLVLDGELTFLLGEEPEEVVAGAGTFVLVPPDVEHTFVNRTNVPVRIANIHAPAGFDLRLRDER